MRLGAIFRYPLKGARGLSLAGWEVEGRGLRLDRRWMLVDGEGRFLSQRTHPRMALLQPEEGEPLPPGAPRHLGDSFQISFPGRGGIVLPAHPSTGEELEVEIWADRVSALAPSPAGDRWFSGVLDVSCRAVFLPEDSLRPVDPEYGAGHSVSFADGFPILLASDASLSELNRRLVERREEPLSVTRFRPNLVVEGVATPHAEDGWDRLRVGEVELRLVKPCARCVVTTVDPGTAEKRKEPLRTLADYRKREGQVFFGQNAVVLRGGRIQEGDPVEVLSPHGRAPGLAETFPPANR